MQEFLDNIFDYELDEFEQRFNALEVQARRLQHTGTARYAELILNAAAHFVGFEDGTSRHRSLPLAKQGVQLLGSLAADDSSLDDAYVKSLESLAHIAVLLGDYDTCFESIGQTRSYPRTSEHQGMRSIVRRLYRLAEMLLQEDVEYLPIAVGLQEVVCDLMKKDGEYAPDSIARATVRLAHLYLRNGDASEAKELASHLLQRPDVSTDSVWQVLSLISGIHLQQGAELSPCLPDTIFSLPMPENTGTLSEVVVSLSEEVTRALARKDNERAHRVLELMNHFGESLPDSFDEAHYLLLHSACEVARLAPGEAGFELYDRALTERLNFFNRSSLRDSPAIALQLILDTTCHLLHKAELYSIADNDTKPNQMLLTARACIDYLDSEELECLAEVAGDVEDAGFELPRDFSERIEAALRSTRARELTQGAEEAATRFTSHPARDAVRDAYYRWQSRFDVA